jgi:signal transduction histidine kinase
VDGAELEAGRNHLHLEFAGLGYGDALRYQFKLDMAGADWSAPTGQRTVEYAQLSPGKYRFLVRALTDDGLESEQPAAVNFVVIAPVWRRAWFLTLTALASGVIISAIYRYRVAQMLGLERMRTRIATDLHDDIGATLSQIAILTEVAHQRAAGGRASEPVERIGALSRVLLESMGDIVWAIQPRNDHLSNLQQRMRRFAADVLSARNIGMHWSVSDSSRDLELNSELRRQVYLIFKESINNIARHSRATEVRITLQVLERRLALEVSDNGCGIVEQWNHDDGNGLNSMKLRAAQLGGELEIRSAGGQGTTVRLRAPLPA